MRERELTKPIMDITVYLVELWGRAEQVERVEFQSIKEIVGKIKEVANGS